MGNKNWNRHPVTADRIRVGDVIQNELGYDKVIRVEDYHGYVQITLEDEGSVLNYSPETIFYTKVYDEPIKPSIRYDSANGLWMATSEDTPYYQYGDSIKECYYQWLDRTTYDRMANAAGKQMQEVKNKSWLTRFKEWWALWLK